MKKVLCVLLIAVFVLCSVVLASCGKGAAGEEQGAESFSLRMNEDGTFKIIQLTDFHEYMFVEGSGGGAQTDLKPALKNYVNGVLDREKPDLVVLTGDNTFCLSTVAEIFYSTNIKTYKAIAYLFESRKQYWTLTFGNHDTDGTTTKLELFNAVSGYEYFVGGYADGEGYFSYVIDERNPTDADTVTCQRLGNFSIPVLDAEGDGVCYNVFLLDSGSEPLGTAPAGQPYYYILDKQSDWYLSRVAALKASNGGTVVPSVLFTHIPLIEHGEAHAQNNDSIGTWVGISPSDTRSKIFEDAMTSGDVKAIFTGHNHQNSWTGFYVRDDKKMMLGVTPQASADDYDSAMGSFRCRKVVLSSDGSLTTCIIGADFAVENGEVLSIA